MTFDELISVGTGEEYTAYVVFQDIVEFLQHGSDMTQARIDSLTTEGKKIEFK